MKFTKMHGLGNDYIYIDCTNYNIEDLESTAIKLSNRNFGIGGDGIILILKSEVADFKMRIFNADGSEAQMCGNGIRCVGKFVYDKKMISKNTIYIETLAGIKKLDLKIDKDNLVESVCVNMGAPILDSKNIPVKINKTKVINEEVIINNNKYNITSVSMGNPHTIIFVPNVDNINIKEIGPFIENNEIFPEKTNVEFIEIINKNKIKMRVWERGAKETLACGTGACASVVASVLNGFTDKVVDVVLKGGILNIKWSEDNDVYMNGTATSVFEGYID